MDLATRNVAACMQASGVAIPVYSGADHPLHKPDHADASFWHGNDGLGDSLLGSRADASVVVQDRKAWEAIVTEALADAATPLDVVCLGPLTNLALAIQSSRELPTRLGTVYCFAGAHTGRGNASPLTAEYNVATDPEVSFASKTARVHRDC